MIRPESRTNPPRKLAAFTACGNIRDRRGRRRGRRVARRADHRPGSADTGFPRGHHRRDAVGIATSRRFAITRRVFGVDARNIGKRHLECNRSRRPAGWAAKAQIDAVEPDLAAVGGGCVVRTHPLHEFMVLTKPVKRKVSPSLTTSTKRPPSIPLSPSLSRTTTSIRAGEPDLSGSPVSLDTIA